MKLLAFAAALSIAAMPSMADWTNEVEFGAVVTTGNTEQENFKLKAESILDGTTMKHTGSFDALRVAENDVTTAEKYYAFYQADFKLDDHQSLFGRVAYEDDRFSGFAYQADATAGYSRHLYESETMTLTGDVGGGFRRSENDLTGATNTEFIARLAANYTWQVSESARFRQFLSAEIGADSTITRSETSLQSTIVGALAMKIALEIKHQSDVPVGRDKTDTETSVTLVYSF